MGAGVAWMVLAGCYLLLAGEATLDEAVAAALTAAVGSVFLLLVRATTGRRMALAAPWRRVLGNPLAQLLPDSWRVGRALLRAVTGARTSGVLIWQPFRPGGDDPPSAGRRALVTLAASLAPNGYVLDLPGDADAMLLHRLEATPAQPNTEWPL